MVNVSLVFVTRNEEVGVAEILPQMDLSRYAEVYAIDGCSQDATCEILERYGVKVYQQSIPGLGGATMEARKRCKTDAMIFFHPDGNEDFRDIPKFLEYLDLGYELIIASRMIKGAYNEDDSKIFKIRKWANLCFALISNTLFGSRKCKVSDVVQGFRAISCAGYDRLNLDQTNCTIDYQMVIRALKAHLRIAEFPTHEGHRIAGATNFASIPTGIAELKMLLREIRLGKSCLSQGYAQTSQVMQPSLEKRNLL
ncbi:MAG: glycosyltransferase [Oculatellaceae cyanobacterium Prado106]|nr:glycosyltransferase [Oculatellaceae cyanobacterium Prado106]